MLIQVFQELVWLDAQRGRQLRDNWDCRVPETPLDAADVSAMQVSVEGQDLL